jgi:hypothetical protein
MNKVFVALAGVTLFHEASSMGNLASIGLGLAAGCLFVAAKAYVPPPPRSRQDATPPVVMPYTAPPSSATTLVAPLIPPAVVPTVLGSAKH